MTVTATPHNFQPTLEFARSLDQQDPLQDKRTLFDIPLADDATKKEVTYLCGNSLGLKPKSATQYVLEELESWGKWGVEGHFKNKNPWFSYHEILSPGLSQIVGCLDSEVVAMNTLTTNLHLLMVSFYRPTSQKRKIVIEKGAFPSDIYAVKSQLQFHGYHPQHDLIELTPRPGERTLRTEDILKTLSQHHSEIALLLLGGVNYLTGQLFALPTITTHAQSLAITVGLDLAHAAGNVPLSLHDWNVDFAVWCSYKYLNSGPGATAAAYVHERHSQQMQQQQQQQTQQTPSARPRFAGWWGQDKKTRFQMGDTFTAIQGAEGWQLSNPAILPMACLKASLDIFAQTNMQELRKKSLLLTGFLEYLLQNLPGPNIDIITPTDPQQRGCQLSLALGARGRAVFQELQQQHIICDWREPDVIRVAPTPLYNKFTEVFHLAQTLKKNARTES